MEQIIPFAALGISAITAIVGFVVIKKTDGHQTRQDHALNGHAHAILELRKEVERLRTLLHDCEREKHTLMVELIEARRGS